MAEIQGRFSDVTADETEETRTRAVQMMQSLIISQMLDNMTNQQGPAVLSLFRGEDSSDSSSFSSVSTHYLEA